ncbi:MAG TPA: HlyD family secretion protein [Candidatus Acidoferrales bacterium]|jgi:membrane fusion protein (multidrug efflux system)|nr:HlyD family secretion protein [Candidatus Acidoferrales bacterium]
MNTATLPVLPRVNAPGNVPAIPALSPGRENINGHGGKNGETGPVTPGKNRMAISKRTLLKAAGALVTVGAVWFAYDWWTVGRFIESTDDAYIGGDVTTIAPKVPGFIAKLSVTDNQPVQAGDLLVKLDDRDYRAALAKAEAAVALQQASLENLEATRHLQESIVAQAQAEISATDAETVRTHDDQGRYQKLLQTGAVSAQSSQQADTSFKQAQAAGQKAGAALDAAKRQLDVIGTQKLQTQAALESAVAERDLARLNLSYTELRAPADGIVGNRSAQTGAYATTGSQLISLVPAHGLWIDANFKESQLARMHPGSPATLEIDSLPGKVLRGHVVSIAPATGAQFSVLPPENATGNFTKIVQRVTVRIVLDDEASAAGRLRPGLSVTAKVNGKSGL